MSESDKAPSMDEILASIRRIIAEDDGSFGDEGSAPGEGAASTAPASTAAAAPVASAPGRAGEESRNSREVAEPKQPPPSQVEVAEVGASQGTSSSLPKTESPPAAASPSEAKAPLSPGGEEASKAFAALRRNIDMSPAEETTLDALVRGMLRPLLRQWLDANLPDMVESLVREEIRRISETRNK